MVGFLGGVVLLLGGKSCGSEKKNQLRMVRSSLSMAPMMYDYAVTKKGFYGKYVLFEQVAEKQGGGKVRTLVTGGTRRYSPEGKELPEEHILIKETYAAGVALAEPGPVESYEFTFADRIAIKLKPGRQAAEVKVASGDVAAAVAPTAEAVGVKRWTAAATPFEKHARLEQLAAIRERYDEQRQAIYGPTPGAITPDEREKIRALEKAQLAEFATVLTPAEFEDYNLRTSNVANNLRYYDVPSCEATFYDGLVGKGLQGAYKQYLQLAQRIVDERREAEIHAPGGHRGRGVERARGRVEGPPAARRDVRPARPAAAAHRAQRRRGAGARARRVRAADERLPADGLGVMSTDPNGLHPTPDLCDTVVALRAGLASVSGLMADSLNAADSPANAHAYIRRFDAQARAVAAATDAAVGAGAPLPPLAGLAVSIKDLFDVAGQPTTGGSKALADALDIVTHVNHRIEQVVKLLVSHHTDASSIINEFEKIRTGELLNSQTFALAHIIKSDPK